MPSRAGCAIPFRGTCVDTCHRGLPQPLSEPSPSAPSPVRTLLWPLPSARSEHLSCELGCQDVPSLWPFAAESALASVSSQICRLLDTRQMVARGKQGRLRHELLASGRERNEPVSGSLRGLGGGIPRHRAPSLLDSLLSSQIPSGPGQAMRDGQRFPSVPRPRKEVPMSHTGESKPGHGQSLEFLPEGGLPSWAVQGVCLWACFQGASGLKGNDLVLLIFSRLPCLVLAGTGPKTQQPKVLSFPWVSCLCLCSSSGPGGTGGKTGAERLGRRDWGARQGVHGVKAAAQSPAWIRDLVPRPEQLEPGCPLQGRAGDSGEASWLDGDGRDGLRPVSLAPGAVVAPRVVHGSLFMACPVPFSKLEMTKGCSDFLPTLGCSCSFTSCICQALGQTSASAPEELSPGLSWRQLPK